jgi:non-canonical poly(A) RNA polymerase PAPD5/7
MLNPHICRLRSSQTINHRRVVQEVYDKRVLHKMLGVEAVAISAVDPPVDPDTAGSASKAYPETAGVAAVWEAADDSESAASEEAPPPPPSRKRKPARQQPAKDADEESAEESRYTIVKDGAGPPAKRRRTGQSADAHTVFTTDEEEREYAVDDGDDSDEEEGEVAEKGRPNGRSSAERRSYWLSKGVGPPDDSD